MIEIDLDALRERIDMEGKYVDFSLLRTTLTVVKVVSDLAVELSDPNGEGECRGTCPKCRKARSFAVNVNTNRFNCFNKGCFLKGGGVIDFIGKLWEVPAKEASHLLACAYGIQPYSSPPVVAEPNPETVTQGSEKQSSVANAETVDSERQSGEAVTREEFDALNRKVERLSMIVWSLLFEKGEVEGNYEFFDEQPDEDFRTTLSAR